MLNTIIFFLLGLMFGSLLNSLIYRFFNKLSLWHRSICPTCKVILKPKDLIPLISYLFAKAKCRYCSKKISFSYFFIELLTGILFAMVYLKYQEIGLYLIRDLFFVFVLIFILFFDLKYYLILDKVIWPVMVVAILVNIYLGIGVWNLVIGIFIGGAFFLLQYALTQGKAIGFGDVKFGLLLGAMLGWQMTILTIIIGYIIGGIVATYLLLSKEKKKGDVLPLGSFLASAAIIVILAGQQIINLFF